MRDASCRKVLKKMKLSIADLKNTFLIKKKVTLTCGSPKIMLKALSTNSQLQVKRASLTRHNRTVNHFLDRNQSAIHLLIFTEAKDKQQRRHFPTRRLSH